MNNDKFLDILSDPEFRIYQWSVKDILKVQTWLRANNVTLDELDGCKIDYKGWNREKIHSMLNDDFRAES